MFTFKPRDLFKIEGESFSKRISHCHSLREWVLDILLALVVGVGSGFGAILFRLLIKFFYLSFYRFLPSFTYHGFNFNLLFIPMVGGLIIGPIVYYVATETKGHGVPELMESVHLKHGIVRLRVLPMKLLVSSITIGSGGSAGREGPIAQIGGTIGSILGQFFNLDEAKKKSLICWGAGAGIAGTFNAPIGGTFFGLEVVMGKLRVRDIVPAFVASLVSAGIVTEVLGSRPAFKTTLPWLHVGLGSLPIFGLLGIVFGVLAFFWVKLFYLIEDFFERNFGIPNWVKPAIGFPVAGIFGAILIYYYSTSEGINLSPMYFGVMGVGYNGIDLALRMSFPIYLFLILGLLKMISTAFTIGSGGSGGIFAPSLYAGTMFGMFIGWTLMGFPAHPDPNVLLPYAVAGMGALFAGAARAPLTAIFQTAEMTRAFNLLPSITIMYVLSYITFDILLKGSSIYTLKLEKKGLRMGDEELMMDMLENIKVGEAMTPAEKVITFSPDDDITDVMKTIALTSHRTYPVVEDGKLLGVLALRTITKCTKKCKKVSDLMSRDMVIAYPDENLRDAMLRLDRSNRGSLIVVSRDDERRLVGILTRTDIIRTLSKYI
ncbi:chloride channel protein [Thermococcus sp. Bubb.Bath]|uniref:chloride channel protein n=1 Tax=Thermococcus sp. Bubb.Bath TaxID=1638242 RepID=UPI00143A63F6|nr:chloride channel protein [Thermococcus sp. Bubb.Bath]NJF25435.1 CBS domain-containing protein [Thermococcus sp. Bubb.Bath]